MANLPTTDDIIEVGVVVAGTLLSVGAILQLVALVLGLVQCILEGPIP